MRVLSWKIFAATMLLVLGTSLQALALSITPALAIDFGNQNDQNDIDAYLGAKYLGISGPLYKDNVGTGEEKPGFQFDGSYETEFLNTAKDQSGATISYVNGQPVITGAYNPVYLFVKDGRQEPAWYLFNLTQLGWDGIETLSLGEFWPDEGSISHVEFRAGVTSVPDGGSVAMLLGIALMGLAGVRRMIT